MSNVNVSVKATVNQDGSVSCAVSCDGQSATIRFTGDEVFIEVPEPAQAAQ